VSSLRDPRDLEFNCRIAEAIARACVEGIAERPGCSIGASAATVGGVKVSVVVAYGGQAERVEAAVRPLMGKNPGKGQCHPVPLDVSGLVKGPGPERN